jgi:hypothetical protein
VVVLLLYIGPRVAVCNVTYTALRSAPVAVWAWYSLSSPSDHCIDAVVLTTLWWGLLVRFLSVSALVWSIAAAVYILLPLTNLNLIFAVGAVLQVLIILWFLFQKYQKQIKSWRRILSTVAKGAEGLRYRTAPSGTPGYFVRLIIIHRQKRPPALLLREAVFY